MATTALLAPAGQTGFADVTNRTKVFHHTETVVSLRRNTCFTTMKLFPLSIRKLLLFVCRTTYLTLINEGVRKL